jgi:hypothetical protein
MKEFGVDVKATHLAYLQPVMHVLQDMLQVQAKILNF